MSKLTFMTSLEWYSNYFAINDYKQPLNLDWLFLSFQSEVNDTARMMIANRNSELGYPYTMFYANNTLMIATKCKLEDYD